MSIIAPAIKSTRNEKLFQRANEAASGNRPASMLVAEIVASPQLLGNYITQSQTWSDRNYQSASLKKLNEQM
jgi:hypothetical protein